MSHKIRCVAADPAITGDTVCPFESLDIGAMAVHIRDWMHRANVGDKATLEIVEHTQAELDEMPSF